MKWPGPTEWLFSVRTFAAAILALYIGLAMDLERPYWAMATVYIASQPFSGATRSKAVYRALGTLLGATAAVALVPNLVDVPAVLCIGLALWVGICLYFALLDRTPRSYVFMLAGYTAAIIGFPSVETPDAIFDTALSRVEEITLGIVCASQMASVVFPRHVGPVLAARIDALLRQADTWALDALSGAPVNEAVLADRRRMAGDIAEIDLLTSYVAWDQGERPDAVQVLRALRMRFLGLMVVLSSLADRVRALRALGPAPPAVAALIERTAAWMQAGDAADPAVLVPLREEVRAALPPLGAHAGWREIIVASLLERLGDLLDLAHDCRVLRRAAASGTGRPAVLAYSRGAGFEHVYAPDRGRAVWSAASAALAILIGCAFWIGSGWADGAVAAQMVAVGCSFFAAMDDPAPAIMSFLVWSVVAVVMDALYLFAALPMASGFPMLVLALAPAFLIVGVLVATPRTTTIGMALGANGATLLSLQSTYNASFQPFINSGIALVVGMGMAAIVTRIVRSVGAEWSALRLLRRNWVDVAMAAARRGQRDRQAVTALMLDRINQVAPRLAAVGEGSDLRAYDLMADVRIGLNIVAIRRARRSLPDTVRAAVDGMLDALATDFLARASGKPRPAGLLRRIDNALAALASAQRGRVRAAILALVGIRRGLFPDAPPYTPPTADAAAEAG